MGRAVSKRKGRKVTRYHSHGKKGSKSTSSKITASNPTLVGLPYFIFHNLVSAIFMFGMISIWFYSIQSDSLRWIVSSDFWIYSLMFILASIISSLLSRVIVFGIVDWIYKTSSKRDNTSKIKVGKNFWEFQTGLNALNFNWLTSIYVSAILYLIGIYFIIGELLWFSYSAFWMFVLSWTMFKLIIALLTHFSLRDRARKTVFFIIINSFIVIAIIITISIGV